MPRIHHTHITIKPNRQRQEFDPEALQELKNSIEDGQLLHPPVLRREGTVWVLVAGERRLRAIQEIYELGGTFKHNNETFSDGYLPFTDIGELTELQAEEVELDENLKRKDLTWQEHAAAVSRLHLLRQAQKKAAAEALPPGTPVALRDVVQTVADTAKELTGKSDGSNQDTIRKELIVAGHLSNPLIAKAKSADEAFKILKREEQKTRDMDLARQIGGSLSSSSHQALNLNCLHFMRDPANAGQFDVICTDPPYGMGADVFGDAGGKLTAIDHRYDDSYESWKILMTEWSQLSFTITKPAAHAYIFCDFDRFHELKALMQSAGWYVFRTPLICHKLNSGRVPLPDRGPRRQYETILYAIKGNKPVTHIYPDVISVDGDENLGHGAQKPVALIQNLLQRSVHPGDKVLDTFAGSGSIFPACHTLKVYATGIEQAPEYFGLCVKRLKSLDDLSNSMLEGI
jgi:DNA modification methylase/ParB-like chromosome segregation protein Spo0J